MKHIRTLFILIFIALSGSINAQENRVIKGFSGGMMIHSGYVFGHDNPFGKNISNITFGMGGCAKIHLSEHFRTGFEGYFSKAPMSDGMEKGSHNKVFWAGALADWFWKCGKLTPYTGVTIGGGTETSFYMFEGDSYDWIPESNIVFRKQPFFAIDPYVGFEYAVGKALRLTLKADWLLAINSEGLNKPQGPRIYLGFIFAH